ncbi:FusB/FusC family EF-G-binding protein [Paenibacillus sp. FSL R5-0636]|uniref:Elongation factor G-binding protein n=1 Tax=Paenibacillus odorifer TaxID=189426 RepID=A0A1R0Z533_9BACL|nr:FusB/FusC family EF-G-binding protein [Paenibacillus odorifer]AWV34470.1 elongation factor G-binding protein [Paenibacillus odorifer]OMC94949.1 elongation factor G-binding protein [Paenibacillus odorifer]OME17759.1 elongation factor G-binding protein [Paenibacillus odorifer]
MCTPFIRNHQYNLIKKQTKFVLHTLRTVADRRVLETVRYSAATNIIEAFPFLTENHKQILEQISTFETAEDFQRYLSELEPYLESYPTITLKQIQKLFPKNKKLKVPDLQLIDYRNITYLSWIDIASNKLFIIYPYEGQFIGIEGRITPTHKKGYCMFCNRHQELAFFYVKTKNVNVSPDNISAVGQYVCLDNQECNRSITDTAKLERFILSVRK